jgi:hypothetical protein
MAIVKRESQKNPIPRKIVYGAPILPISGYMEKENGKVIKHLVGIDCQLLGGAAFVESCDGGVIATIRLDTLTQSLIFDFPLCKGYTAVEKKFDLEAGTRIAVTVTSEKPEMLSGVWVTLVCRVKHSKRTLEHLLEE